MTAQVFSRCLLKISMNRASNEYLLFANGIHCFLVIVRISMNFFRLGNEFFRCQPCCTTTLSATRPHQVTGWLLHEGTVDRAHNFHLFSHRLEFYVLIVVLRTVLCDRAFNELFLGNFFVCRRLESPTSHAPLARQML